MSRVLESAPTFVERRSHDAMFRAGRERRQFADSYEGLTPEVKELADAIDQYKLRHRRRFITYQEILDVVLGLGYHK